MHEKVDVRVGGDKRKSTGRKQKGKRAYCLCRILPTMFVAVVVDVVEVSPYLSYSHYKQSAPYIHMRRIFHTFITCFVGFALFLCCFLLPVRFYHHFALDKQDIFHVVFPIR